MTTTPTPPPPDPYAVELALASALAEISNAQDTQIAQAWAQAWSAVSTELLDTLTVILTDAKKVNTAAVVRYQRLNTVLGQIANHLDDLAQHLGVTITSDLNDVVQRAEVGTRELIAAQRLLHDERRGLPVRRVPSPAMQAIVRRTTEQVTSQLQPLADDTYALILHELTKGTAAGDNPRQTAARMVARAEDMHNFGRSRALNIARTETLDAYRAGAKASEDQYTDLLAGWAWVAHLGNRTCRSCLSMNGRIFDLDVAGPDDHPQGRCSRVPVVREDDGSVDTSWLPDAEAHFESLSPEDQQAILGQAGYRQWLAGDFPIDQWTKHRTNAGWRDSQVPASPSDPQRGSTGSGTSQVPGSGGGSTPPGGGQGPTGTPGRVLPFTDDFPYAGNLRAQGNTVPFSYTALERLGLIAPANDPDIHFSDPEKAAADWLRSHGLTVRSVAPADHLGATPDAVIDGPNITVEIKTLDAGNMTSVRRAIVKARRQSPYVVVNGQDINLDRNPAEAGLARALGLTGANLSEVVVLLGGGSSVGWARG